MPAPVYATRDDLTDSPYRPDSVPVPDEPEATRKLTRASRKVDDLLLTAIYDVDDDGAPTDPDITEALRDATCAIAAYWLETGDESGVMAQYQSVGIGSVQLTRGDSGTGSAAGSMRTVSPDAVQVLQQAGLLVQGPITW